MTIIEVTDVSEPYNLEVYIDSPLNREMIKLIMGDELDSKDFPLEQGDTY